MTDAVLGVFLGKTLGNGDKVTGARKRMTVAKRYAVVSHGGLIEHRNVFLVVLDKTYQNPVTLAPAQNT